MNAFIARLQRKLADYNDSARKQKVEWFRTVVQLDPKQYKLEYRKGELHLLKLVMPETKYYDIVIKEIWQWVDSTEYLPPKELQTTQ